MFSEQEIEEFSRRGISVDTIDKQIAYFKSGFPFLPIKSAAIIADGITRYTEEEIGEKLNKYDALIKGLKIVKFVPASGAATRMFKELYEYVNEDKSSGAVQEVLDNITEFGFYDELKGVIKDSKEPKDIIRLIIESGLGYGKLPKGLIKFHKYEDGARTVVEEHIVEAALYAKSSDSSVNMHFTVSAEHQSGFESVIAEVLPKYEAEYGVKFNISYSQQKAKTDTIAVDMDNNPFREADGSILLRPAGHGALLENLNDIDADMIYIKTVDNVLPDHLKSDTVKFKKVLAVTLLEVQQRCFEYLNALDCGANENLIEEIVEFIKEDLSHKFEYGFDGKSLKEKSRKLKTILNRPVRVCGMVKNEGEPGGGPFWVNNADGSQSLQIAESSQISQQQKKLIKSSTHFNPVDLVCCVKNKNNEKFNLAQYIDPETGFISIKSKNGRELKAQELPGLWNGAMANWNTIFVEVPISTFAPVKNINDLLRPQHQ